MPPKAKAPSKAEKAEKAKKLEDKTFGLKNKNKSKAVQQYIKQATSTANQLTDEERKRQKEKEARDRERAAQAEREALFKPVIVQSKAPQGADPKSVVCAFFKQGKCTKGGKCKFSHDLSIERKAAKINVYADKRDDIYADQETLENAISQKEGGHGRRCASDKICKHFLEAVERRQYGWVWTCPNGGDKCQYRHALPPGYKLKSELEAERLLMADQEGPTIEDEIEEQRAQLKVRTPLTYELFLQWRARKVREGVEAEEAKLTAAKEARSKGKEVHSLSGRALFSFDPSLFADDANARGDDSGYFADYARRRAGAGGLGAASGAGGDEEEEDEDEERYAAHPLYDPTEQGGQSDDDAADADADDDADAGGGGGEEEVEWFCDGCEGDILTAHRYDCPECDDEFCLCIECYETQKKDASKAHPHALVRMARHLPHASVSPPRDDEGAATSTETAADAAGGGGGGAIDASLFDAEADDVPDE